jgi:hypothetical protein
MRLCAAAAAAITGAVGLVLLRLLLLIPAGLGPAAFATFAARLALCIPAAACSPADCCFLLLLLAAVSCEVDAAGQLDVAVAVSRRQLHVQRQLLRCVEGQAGCGLGQALAAQRAIQQLQVQHASGRRRTATQAATNIEQA